jgi:localization factor PodJL
MASEATWQSGGAHRTGETSADGPMDQRTVESLLRRLVERVEESERRYSEALDDLHARLDQLSQTTDAVRASSTPEASATLDRLHDQVSSLARRFEPQTTNPLEDFERLGKALSANLDFAAGGSDGLSGAAELPSALPAAPTPPKAAATAPQALPDFGFKAPEFPFSASSFDLPPLGGEGAIDKRLADVAHQLEHSLGTVMPAATIEALNARLDEIASQLSQALRQAPKLENLASVEKQLSEMGQQLSRAEAQLARMNGIEEQLRTLIERFDAAPDVLEEIANKAASEAARLVAEKTKSGASEDRLNAMHRDLAAMSDKARASDERIAGSLQAVHESLKQLVAQVERSSSGALQPPKPQVPFAERIRAQAPQGLPPLPPFQQPPMAAGGGAQVPAAAEKEKSLKSRLAGSISDFQDGEPAPQFGRGKRAALDEEAVDLDATSERGKRAPSGRDEFAHDDLVAAARRAAQAAALKAEERTGGGRPRRAADKIALSNVPDSDAPAKRKRSILMISAVILLVISAALLYSRLRSKPEVEATPPATEESVPGPAGSDEITPLPEGSRHGTALPGASQSAPVPVEPAPDAAPPAHSGAWEAVPDDVEQDQDDSAATGFNQGIDPSPDDSEPAATSQAGGGVTDVAKSSYRRPVQADDTPRPQPASFTPEGMAALPPGVSVSIEEPVLGASSQAMAPAQPMPAKLPLPPEALGPLSLRQAASAGDPRAQYAIALRYAQGQGTAEDLTEAAHWLERAASAGLAPAQYRLASMYERGQGVAKDLGKARSWYAAAAEKGNVKAMHNLAVSVSGGQGNLADYGLAAKWYGEAASYGLADSQYNLGILAEHGLGMATNLGAAYQWFALAAKNGDTEAAKRRDQVKAQLDPKALAAAEQAVKGWKAKPALPEANAVAEPEEWVAQGETPTGGLVARAQKLLNKLGYDAGPANGQLDDQTRNAIKSFERRNGLEETGEVNIPLVTNLERLTS